jgi:hypothetical protein
METFTRRHHSPATRRLALAGLVASLVAAGCARQTPTDGLSALCAGHDDTRNVTISVDSVRPPGGQELTAMIGQSFSIQLTFAAAPATGVAAGTGGANGCEGKMGTGSFTSDLPQRLRTATSEAGNLSWRIDGEMVFVDLHPRTNDNNLVLALPVAGGTGHWGLSTFAGEVAYGRATTR